MSSKNEAHWYHPVMLCAALLVLSTPAKPVAVYVSETGTLSGDGSQKKPFKTLEQAQTWLKSLPANRGDVEIRLKGTVFVKDIVDFGPEAHDLKVIGPGTVDGGVEVTGWKADRFNDLPCFSAPAPKVKGYLQLFKGENRLRVTRPQLPVVDYFQAADFANPADARAEWNVGQDQMLLKREDLEDVKKNLQDVEAVFNILWTTSRMPFVSYDPQTQLAKFGKKSVFKCSDDHKGPGIYRLENVAEAFGKGNFYIDKPASKIYYCPLDDSERKKLPRCWLSSAESLVRFKGAKNVQVENVTFQGAEPLLPANSSGSVQAAFEVPGAVQIIDSESVILNQCTVREVGGYGVQIDGKSVGCKVTRSFLMFLGAGGINVGNGPMNCDLSDNVISSGGRIHPSGIGILVRLSGGNVISHNLIQDFYYTGISVGWDWGFADTAAKNNIVEYNKIALIGQGVISDMGGIYVLGKQPGSVIRNNWISTVYARTYGGWGIYLDEGSTGWTVENNIALDTKTGGFHIHYGGNNLIQNNIFAYAKSEGQLIRQRDNQQGPITFKNNLIVAREGDAPLVVPNWLKRDVVMSGNLYSTPPGPLPFGDDGTGKFVKVELDDKGNPKTGEVYKFGFKKIDMSSVGPRR